MNGGFRDYHMAGRLRETINKLAESAVDKKRPPPRYAEVRSLTGPEPNTCLVRFTNEEEDQVAALASVRPSRSGQIVRIEGTLGDRYVADVLGDAVIQGGGIFVGSMFTWPGTVPPTNTRRCDGSLVEVDVFPELFSILQYRFGGSGNTFALPTENSPNPNLMVVIRVM